MSRRVELLLLLSFCCYEALAPAVPWDPTEVFSLQLIGGAHRCEGELQVQRKGLDWTGVFPLLVPQWFGAQVCAELRCGSVIALKEKVVSKRDAVVMPSNACENTTLSDCFGPVVYELGLGLEVYCSETFSLRLVGGASRCRGDLQVQRDGRAWTGVFPLLVPQWFGARVCAELDCGPVLAVKEKVVSKRAVVTMSPKACKNASLSHCFGSDTYRLGRSWEVNCTDSVRLVRGRSLCSGSLQIQDQSLAPSWTSVCEGALGRRGAEVLCRELGCGAPLLQGELSPLGKTFHCEGHESKLMDCPQNQTRTGSETCPPLQLSCAEPLRLVGGPNRCEGTLEVRHRGEWRRMMTEGRWPLDSAAVVCRSLDCGSAVSTEMRLGSNSSDVWVIFPDCEAEAPLRDCVFGPTDDTISMEVVCSDSVRLVGGRSLCSGSLQIQDQSSVPSWTSVCEGALGCRGAEVLCRELGCGAPLLQGALSPLGQTFHCEGHESKLMDCPRNQTRTGPETCPTLQLTCEEPLRLVRGSSRCEGTLELKFRGEWRPVMTSYYPWDLEAASGVCRDLGCGSALSRASTVTLRGNMWGVKADCVKRAAVRECVFSRNSYRVYDLDVQCSGHQEAPEGGTGP